MSTDFDFGARPIARINIGGIETRVVNLKGSVLSVTETEVSPKDIQKYGNKKLEILIQPEATPKRKKILFYGDSPVSAMDYISTGIILSEPLEVLREALYVIVEYRDGGFYPREISRTYKHGYESNPQEDKTLGLIED